MNMIFEEISDSSNEIVLPNLVRSNICPTWALMGDHDCLTKFKHLPPMVSPLGYVLK